MIHDWKMELYWRLPVFLQEAALSIYARHLEGVYYGPGYKEWYERFKSWKAWPVAQARAWQNEQLQSIVGLAATRVPYYREKWRKLDWKSVRCPDDLQLLPLLDKESIRQNEEAFIVERLNPNSLWMDRTSGTTGTALKIYWPLSALPKWWALTEVMVRNAAGVGQEIPRAMMGGRTIVRGNAKQPPYWRFNRRWRQLYLSSYHVSRDTVRDYAAGIRQYGSEWITGYGSAIAALAQSALEADVPPVSLRSAIVSGDTLLPGMRASIEKFFQCKCFNQYGQSEGVSMAMECLHGRMHVSPAAGILEILREDGSPCPPGEVGEMVATGLLNEAMPLIRYRLGDHAAWAEDENCPCGNPHPVITNLEGRMDDYVITASGRRIGRLAGFRRSPTIHSAQLVQDSLTHAFLLVRPGINYCYRDALAIKDDILARVGELEIDIVEVTEIPKTPQGKTVLVVRLADRPEMRGIYEKLLSNRKTQLTEEKVASSVESNASYSSSALLKGLKILVITSGHEATDPRIYAKEACSLRRLGADVVVVGKLENGTATEVTVLKVPKPSARWVRFLWQPWRCLWAARRLSPDIIHFHDAEMLAILPVAKLWWRRSKFIYDVHEDFGNLMLVRDWLPSWAKLVVRVLTNTIEKGLASFADAIVGVTPPLTDKFRNKNRITAYNYNSLEFFDRAAETMREPQRRTFDLAHLGTLSLRRAVFLSEVIREFHRLHPKARSLVIGVSPEIEAAMKARIPDGCLLLGKTPYQEIPALLGNAKVGLDVHPWLGPHLEVALPVKVCEYMAAGCAVVSSCMPVLDQLLDQAGAGPEVASIIKSEEPADYAKAVVLMIEKIEGGADPGSKLRELALKHMVWEGEAKKIAHLYRSLLGKPCVT